MFQTPQETEAAFYAALERADLDAMMDVWADDDNIACVHPMGKRLEGREEVTESWRRIFKSGGRMRFRLSDAQHMTDEAVAVHVLHENITVADRPNESVVLATNVYRRTADGWRMVLHHASLTPIPEDEEDEEDVGEDDEDGPKILH